MGRSIPRGRLVDGAAFEMTELAGLQVDQIVAYTELHVMFDIEHGRTSRIECVAVDQAFQQRGYGTTLTRRVIREALGMRLELIELIAEEAHAIRMYESQGFVRTDQLLMRKEPVTSRG